MKKKKYFLLTAGALAALAVAFFVVIFAGRGGEGGPEKDAVLYLDGTPVSAEEYELLARENRNRIFMQYSSEEANRADFWITGFDGTYPWEQLSELVLEELRKNYAIKEMAVELGLTEEYDFTDLQTAMDEKNEAADSNEGGEIQYGLTNYDMNTYYQYWYSNLEARVVTALISEGGKVSEEECQAYYREHGDEYTYETGVRLLYIELSFESQEREAVFQTGQELARRLQETEDPDVIQQEFPEADVRDLVLTSFDPREGLSGVYARRWELASQLREGEIYGPYEDNGLLCVMKCVDRTQNGSIPFSEAEADIQAFLERTGARTVLDDRARKMKISEGEISARDIITNMQ